MDVVSRLLAGDGYGVGVVWGVGFGEVVLVGYWALNSL